MIISPIQTYKYSRVPSFNSNCRSIYDKQGNLLYKTTTCFFREDLHWDSFVKLLNQKYKMAEKVNIINHACSNGQEPYSLVIKLIQHLGKDAEKFFPIQAKDFDSYNIENAKKGLIGINFNDIYQVNSGTKNNITQFFKYEKSYNSINDLTLVPKDNIKNKVIFSQSDILKDLEQKQPDNTVILCRNFWPYLSAKTREKLASLLAKNIGTNSLVAIGSFDCSKDILHLLEKRGFRETSVSNVFSKP